MVHAFVIYCLVLASTTCVTVEVVPVDGHEPTTFECMWAGMAGSSAPFLYNGEWWQQKGARCANSESDVRAWLDAKKVKQ